MTIKVKTSGRRKSNESDRSVPIVQASTAYKATPSRFSVEQPSANLEYAGSTCQRCRFSLTTRNRTHVLRMASQTHFDKVLLAPEQTSRNLRQFARGRSSRQQCRSNALPVMSALGRACVPSLAHCLPAPLILTRSTTRRPTSPRSVPGHPPTPLT